MISFIYFLCFLIYFIFVVREFLFFFLVGEIYCLTVLEARSPKSVWAVCSFFAVVHLFTCA
jgi:hypothetical protein